MLKNISQLEIVVDSRSFRFLCDNDAPLMHVKEALFQFQKYVGQIEDKIKEQQESEKKDEKPPEVVD